jgi:hypothetical protein
MTKPPALHPHCFSFWLDLKDTAVWLEYPLFVAVSQMRRFGSKVASKKKHPPRRSIPRGVAFPQSALVGLSLATMSRWLGVAWLPALRPPWLAWHPPSLPLRAPASLPRGYLGARRHRSFVVSVPRLTLTSMVGCSPRASQLAALVVAPCRALQLDAPKARRVGGAWPPKRAWPASRFAARRL